MKLIIENWRKYLLKEFDPSPIITATPRMSDPGYQEPSSEDVEAFLSGLGTALEVADAVMVVAAVASGAGIGAVLGREALKQAGKQGLKKTAKDGIKKHGKTAYEKKLKQQIKNKKQAELKKKKEIKFRDPKTNVKPKDVKQKELFDAQNKRIRGEKLSAREQDILDILDWQPRQLSHLEQGVHLGAEVGIKSVDWHIRNNPLFKGLYGREAEDAARDWIKDQIKLRKEFIEFFQ
tara:strand:- start:117 stop:821 length:705 start_codon:yes stop_codon:yes gene_type:complete